MASERRPGVATAFAAAFVAALGLAAAGGARAMTALDETELAGISGQAGSLFVADRIGPNELENPNANSNYTFGVKKCFAAILQKNQTASFELA